MLYLRSYIVTRTVSSELTYVQSPTEKEYWLEFYSEHKPNTKNAVNIYPLLHYIDGSAIFLYRARYEISWRSTCEIVSEKTKCDICLRGEYKSSKFRTFLFWTFIPYRDIKRWLWICGRSIEMRKVTALSAGILLWLNLWKLIY